MPHTQPQTQLPPGTPPGRWIDIIRAEYLEVPGLSLTLPQARRMWGLDDCASATVFEALVDAGFLRRTRTGTYVRQRVG